MTTTTINLQFLDQTPSTQSMAVQTWKVIQLWRSRARQRMQLADLSPELLRDVDISLDAARAEAAKPFWRA